MFGKRGKIVLSFLICLIFILLLYLAINLNIIKFDGKLYFTLSDSKTSFKVENLLKDKTISIISSDDSDTTEVYLSDLGLNYKLIDSNSRELDNFPRYLDLNKVLFVYIDDESIFRGYFDDLNSSLKESTDAYYSISDSDIILNKEVRGTKVDIDLLISDNKDGVVELDLNNYIVEPKVPYTYYSTTETEVDKLKNWKITYTNGLVLDYRCLLSHLSVVDKDLVFNTENLSEDLRGILKEGLKSYNTVGSSRDFTTIDNITIILSTGTYGDVVDIEDEVSYIIDSLVDYTSESNRLPCMSLDLPDEIPNTYIEVSIDQQHLWYFVDGVLVMETDVVTGTKDRHDTPTGIYYISERIGGKYLRGDGYKTWVNQWMRLTNSGIGLHDAYWRGTFGGTIYTYNGSHGCINLPKVFAKDLFNSVTRKTAVIIY